MERGWDRRTPFIELSTAELARFVGAAVPGARVVAAQPLTSGLRNTNYRLELAGGGAFVLRLYVADPEACAREAAVLGAMADRVPAPRVLYSDPAAAPPFALLEWLEGTPLHEVLDEVTPGEARELAAACGASLARIHEIRFPGPGFLGGEMRVVRPMSAWSAAVLATLAGPVEGRLGPELSARLRDAVESNAARVAAVWSGAVLVHADYKPWNLLVAREAAWRITGVLDWEFVCAGCRLIDFATFLRDEGARPPGFVDAFAAAYLAAGGTLPDDWRRLTRLVDLLNMVQLLESPEPKRAEDIRRLVAETLSEI